MKVQSIIVRPSALVATLLVASGALAHGRALETAPPRGYEIRDVQANVFESNSQESPSIAIDPNSGRALVVWGSRRQENGGFGVFGRLFDAQGLPIGGEIHINRTMTNNQELPAVAFAPDGSAWVAWQSYLQDGDQGSIVLRRFGDRDGRFRALSEEIIANTTTAGDQTLPDVAASADRVMVTWMTTRDDRAVVAGRMFDAAGSPLGEEFLLGDFEHYPEALPRVAPSADGGFIAVWAERNLNHLPRQLVAQRFDRDGKREGETLSILEDTERHAIEPAIATDAEGRAVIAWLAASDSNGWDVTARRFDSEGNPLGAAFTVATAGPDAWKSGVDVAIAPSGRQFIIAFNSEHDGPVQVNKRSPYTPAAVMARLYDAEGEAQGESFVVSQSEDGRRVLPIARNNRRVAWGEGGSVYLAWQGLIGEDSSGVGVSILAPRAIHAAATVEQAELELDPAIMAAITITADTRIDRFPPEWDPFFRPDPPDGVIRSPGPDFGFQGFQSTGWNPPDPDLAVGTDHVVVVVNGGIRVYTKSGQLVFDDDISGTDGFWGEVGATHFVFDPVAVYDVFSGRYIVATTEHADNDDQVINIAVSVSGNPLDGWHKYRFDMSAVGDFIDFPNLGVGPDAVYICTDYFSGNTGNRIHIFDKSRMLVGDPVTPKVITTSSGFRSLGAVNHLTLDAPAQYFATSFDGGSSSIGLDAVRDPNGTPIRNNVLLSVPSFSQPPNAQQAGSSNRVSTVDMRIKNGVFRDGYLWLTHTIGQDSTARVRWYKIDMNGWPTSGVNPVLEDWGTQNLGPGVHNWFADPAVDGDGVLGIGFNRSSAKEFVSVQRTFRLPIDPPGTLREPILQQISDSPETSSRWGDYGGIEHDVTEPGVFWNHHQYRTTSWRTWVGRFDVYADLAPLAFVYPKGRPEVIDSGGGTLMQVQIIEQAGTLQPGTAVLYVGNPDESFTAYPMNDLGGNLFEAIFPPTECDTIVPYYVAAESTKSIEVTDPPQAPLVTHAAASYASVEIVLADDFESDLGWTVENIDLLDGEWERGVPAGDGSRGDPTSDFDGSGQCYLTGNRLGNSDVDGGPTRLISPLFDLSATPDATIRYARWFFNDDGDQDRLDVEISNDDGAIWVLVESVADNNTGGWHHVSITPADFVAPTAQMRMRFSATDNPNNSVTEAAIDAFEVVQFTCEGGGTTEIVDYDVALGSEISGGLDELRSSDNTYLRVRSQFGFTAQEANVTNLIVGAVTTVGSPSTLTLTFEGRLNNPGGNARFRLRNWSTGTFQEVFNFTVGTTEVVRIASDIPATNRINGDGRIELSTRISVLATFSASGFDTFFDMIHVSVNN